jgi:hypothetical protein
VRLPGFLFDIVSPGLPFLEGSECETFKRIDVVFRLKCPWTLSEIKAFIDLMYTVESVGYDIPRFTLDGDSVCTFETLFASFGLHFCGESAGETQTWQSRRLQ